MSLTGGCRCGEVRYAIELEGLPTSYACHCRDCQTWSGSAFALHSLLPENLLTLSGDPVDFQLRADETMASIHIGCPVCMTRIANRNAAVPGMIIVRAGTLDRSDEIVPAAHIWTRRKQPWVNIGNSPDFAETPSHEQFAKALRADT
ncbi:MAG: GFA family protein [Sphingobium sp.]